MATRLYSCEEIERFVEEYLEAPRGTKKAWLDRHRPDFSRRQFEKWRRAYLAGDLAEGRVPRGPLETPRKVMSAQHKLKKLEKSAAAERAAYEEKIAKLETEIQTLRDGNIAMGKAFGLLQQMSQEPE